METRTDDYIERGKQSLAQGQARDSAIAYAQAAQIEGTNPIVHLGLAEANLALGNYDVVQMACQRVQELQPNGGVEAMTAQALLDLLYHRYDRALQNIDMVLSEDPSIAYAHAMRAYLLRINKQDYDANLARARAARLSYGGRFDKCFPALGSSDAGSSIPSAQNNEHTNAHAEQDVVPPWSQSNGMRRQMVRTRFALSQYPGLVTNTIIAINVIIYLILVVLSRDLNINSDVLFAAGAQFNIQATGEYWRIFTAMFLHFSIFHVGLNMLSLFFIGRPIELIFGKSRYLIIYLASGIVGGIITALLQSNALAAGASGAIFGVFGALGAFYIVNRNALRGTGAIGNWLFWLGLNLVLGFSNPSIGILDHIGGLVAGIVLAFLLLPRERIRRV